jgi:hypothetical protein
VHKSYNDIDITLNIVIITKITNILELSYQMLRKLYCGLCYDYSFILQLFEKTMTLTRIFDERRNLGTLPKFHEIWPTATGSLPHKLRTCS